MRVSAEVIITVRGTPYDSVIPRSSFCLNPERDNEILARLQNLKGDSLRRKELPGGQTNAAVFLHRNLWLDVWHGTSDATGQEFEPSPGRIIFERTVFDTGSGVTQMASF